MRHKFMPISVSLKDRPCLVVGGGSGCPAGRSRACWNTTPRSPSLRPKSTRSWSIMPSGGGSLWRSASTSHPRPPLMVSSSRATDDVALNRRVHEDARGTGALVNVVDDPPHCDFIFPAVLRRDCLTTAISTDGKAPFISGHLRVVLDNVFPGALGAPHEACGVFSEDGARPMGRRARRRRTPATPSSWRRTGRRCSRS